MALEREKYERVADDSPDRCRANVAGSRQCSLKASPGSFYCQLHMGYDAQIKAKAESARNYQLTKWRANLDRHAGSSNIKSLREEIGILRMVMEEKLNGIQSEGELLLASGEISDLVRNIERTVVSCHRIEDRMGECLDKHAVNHIALRILAIITDTFADQPEKLAIVGERILTVVKEGAAAVAMEDSDLEINQPN
jgi:hypothetical protein